LDIENIAKDVKNVKEVHDIRMRKLGPYLVGDMHVVVDGDMSVREADQIAILIEEQVKKEFDEVTEIKVRIEPPKPSTKSETTRKSPESRDDALPTKLASGAR
jgi:divalent metal cation (Fe/Co/Zn/Cd) transporter